MTVTRTLHQIHFLLNSRQVYLVQTKSISLVTMVQSIYINAVLRIATLSNDMLGSGSTFVIVNRCCRVAGRVCSRIKWFEGTILFLIDRPSLENIDIRVFQVTHGSFDVVEVPDLREGGTILNTTKVGSSPTLGFKCSCNLG